MPQSLRQPLVAGNWKMNKTVSQAHTFVNNLKEAVAEVNNVEIVVCPPYTALFLLNQVLKGSNIFLGAQNMYYYEQGAFTGEISPLMLQEVGCRYVILGHSERRRYFSEVDTLINLKVKVALRAGLIPIICVGEQLADRQAGKTEEVVQKQLVDSLAGLEPGLCQMVVVAYEPVWAIGTGQNATAFEAQEVSNFIRKLLADNAGSSRAEKVRLLYGGSVKPDNMAGFIKQPDIDGALVGGASLEVADFSLIIKAVQEVESECQLSS
ncbi:MAG: hypothetical protein STSR0004_04090 [Peptococcaceae bacterium]